ncbi:MAG: SDR family oxidoreductase [Actinomycetota bacterium]
MGRLDGRAALITGGTTGLGNAIAERFLEEGARVIVTGRDEQLGKSALEELSKLGNARFVAADSSDENAVRASVERAAALFGALDVLVNNAGVGVAARTLDTPVEDFDRVMDTNVRGYFLYAREAYPLLKKRRGCMIHVASDAGVLGEPSIGVYSVSKAAVIMLSNMLAIEGGPDVRSNCIAPGDVFPGMRHMAPPGRTEGQEDASKWLLPPIGRIGEAADVASAAVFFATEESAFCTGSTLLVDGGMRAGYSTGRPKEGI